MNTNCPYPICSNLLIHLHCYRLIASCIKVGYTGIFNNLLSLYNTTNIFIVVHQGHRSSRCTHFDRPLLEVKKKGRPISQCPTCRLLRKTRKMHNKCVCNQANSSPESSPDSPLDYPSLMIQGPYDMISSRPVMESSESPSEQYKAMRLIVPKSEDTQETMLQQFAAVVTSSLDLSTTAHGDIPLNKIIPPTAKSLSSCCSSKKKAERLESTDNISNSTASSSCCSQSSPENKRTNELEPCCTNNRPCASSNHTHPKETNRVVLVTCRCGDDCACPGCDVHPSKVMKSQKDPYAGYTSASVIGEATVIHRKPSMDSDSSQDWKSPTAVFDEHGAMLCGCGCDRPFDNCRGCEHGLYD
jgi:hypothetical protein